MTNKYETLYSQIGACVDKLIARGFTQNRFDIFEIEKRIGVVFEKETADVYPWNRRLQYQWKEVYFRHDETKFKYSDPNWQEQLLNKVDELLKENDK